MPSLGEDLFDKYYRVDSPEERMRPSMPCHKFKVDKRSRGPVFGEYVHLKGRISLHMRHTCHLSPPISHLKGRTSLYTLQEKMQFLTYIILTYDNICQYCVFKLSIMTYITYFKAIMTFVHDLG